MRVAALGRTRMLWNSIKLLHSKGHQIRLIATCKAAPEYDVHENDFRTLAEEIGAQFLLTQNVNTPEALEVLKQAEAEIAVSANWINIIGPGACNSFKHGILNAHAGALPRYRGNANIAWAILQGEERLGVTIHKMDPYEVDAGPAVLRDDFSLSDNTYIAEVYKFLEDRIPILFLEAIEGLGTGRLIPTPQPRDPAKILRCYPRRPEDALIDWNQTAKQIARLVRASSEPFAGAFTYFKGKRLIIWRAHEENPPFSFLAVPGQVTARDEQSGQVSAAAGNGFLVVEEVETATAGRCYPAAIIKRTRDRFRAHHSEEDSPNQQNDEIQ